MATISDKSYWERRSEQRLVTSEIRGNRAILNTVDIYNEALNNIQKEIDSIYRNYTRKSGTNTVLDTAALTRALDPAAKAQFLKDVSAKARELGLNPKEVFDDRYLARLNRLEALKTQAQLEIYNIAPQTVDISSKAYSDIVNKVYKSTSEDTAKTGIIPSFSTLDTSVTNKILQSKWVGGNYSTRIWGNTDILAGRLPTIIGGSIMSGASIEKTARLVRDEFGVSKRNAARLIRTESAYFNEQGEAQSYIDDGIETYDLLITLDGRTSQICRNLDAQGLTYRVDQIIPGINYPPFHTDCRTTTTANFDKIGERPKTQAARLKRFESYVDDNAEIQRRWRKAMTNQMNPSKLEHDYNADLNRITQNTQGAEMVKQLDNLMAKIPLNDPERKAIAHVAEMNGWKENDPAKPNATELKVTQAITDAGLDPTQLQLSPQQFKFIDKSGISFESIRSDTQDINGIYDQDTNKISIDVANLVRAGKELGQPNYYNRVIQHELGHAADELLYPGSKLSDNEQFRQDVGEKAPTAEAYAISKFRIAEGITDTDLKENISNMSPEVFEAMVRTGETITVNGNTFRVPADAVDYHLERPELFAEAYSLYHINPKYLEENAPNLFKFMRDNLNGN